MTAEFKLEGECKYSPETERQKQYLVFIVRNVKLIGFLSVLAKFKQIFPKFLKL